MGGQKEEKKAETFRPATQISTAHDSDAAYTTANVKAPPMSGIVLKIFVQVLESCVLGSIVKKYMKSANQITKIFMESTFHEPPMHIPHYPAESTPRETEVIEIDQSMSPCECITRALDCLDLSTSFGDAEQFQHWTIRDYATAYSTGKTTPTQVAKHVLLAVKESIQPNLGMHFFINYDEADVLQQAADSTYRYKRGEPLSILDGVPIAVKDEIDCLPYPTTGGTTWLHKMRPVNKDAACIKRLRDCGTVFIGKTNMHELGMGTTCINPHYGATRNPYNRNKFSGGSSGGSAAVVASGLCPVALGVDGGGSVRMPSAICGVVGFKATFGRLSNQGVLPLNWTVGMVGTHTTTVEDALLVYAAISGHLPNDNIISMPPSGNLPNIKDLKKENPKAMDTISCLKLAKYTEWFEDSDKDVKDCCQRALELLKESYGCQVVEVTVPELEEMRLAHFITIGCECYSSLGSLYEKIGISESGQDARVGFSIYSSFSSREFLSAQRMRSRQMHYFTEIFKKADVIVTPTTGCTAQPIEPNAMKYGELNYVVGAKLMRYQIAGNFLGLPAISIPVGYDNSGMPVGLQLLGAPWSEATLLRLASVIENLCSPARRKPEVFFSLLE